MMIDRFVGSCAHALSRKARLHCGVAALAVVVAGPALAQTTPAPADAQPTTTPTTITPPDAVPATTAPASATVGTPDTTTPPNDEIVVTGYAQSIKDANTIKKRAVNVIEAISAEDIGKLPDVSIADSLSRLTGVAVQESAGRAKYISIRGFGPDYTTTTLNGRTIATVDDNRRFDFGQFPGDLFQQIEVIKTPSADLMNFGLAGAVDLQTYDPLHQKNAFSINAQGEIGQYKSLNPDGTNKGYKVSAVFVHKFADDTIGVSLGVSAIQDPTQNYHWATGGGNGNYYGPTSRDPSGNIGPDDIQNYVNTNTLYRQSAFAHVAWEPNDRFEFALDGLYTQSRINELSRGWEMPLASWSHDKQVGGETASDGYVTSETWQVDPVLRNDDNTSRAKTMAFGANLKYHLSDSVRFMLDANYSQGKRHDNTYEIYGGTIGGDLADATITRKSDGSYGVDISGIDLSDPTQVAITDPQGWNQVGFNNVPDLKDTVKGFRAELDGDLHGSFFKSWEAGVNYSDERKVSNYSGYFICLPGPASVAGCGNDNINGTSLSIPDSIIQGTIEPYGVTGTRLIALDSKAAQALLRTSIQSLTSSVARDWTVDEKIWTGYVQANYDTEVSGKRVSGNLGLQVVNTNQSSVGFGATDATTVVPQSGGDKYTYFLPSVNMNIELAHNLLLRLGASRTLARATMDDENASYAVSSCGTNDTSNGGKVAHGCLTVPLINGKIPVLQGSGGNPYIRPYFSTNVDLSLERYFAHDNGKLALAAYYKAVSNFTTQNLNLNTGNVNSQGPQNTSTFSQDCSAFVGSLQGATLTSDQTLSCWSTAPNNNGSGYVAGYEASATVPLNTIAPFLDGFSVIGQYSYTDSEIRFSNSSRITLPGLSKEVIQGQIFFEKWGFNARASLTHRSSYLGDYQLFNAQVTANLTKPQTTLDAQVGYDFTSGFLNGLSIYVQGHNLTNSKSISYVNDDPKEVNIRDQYGRTYLAGVTFKF